MTALSDVLRHVAACAAPSHMECPTFRRMVREAVGARPRPAAPGRVAGVSRGATTRRPPTTKR